MGNSLAIPQDPKISFDERKETDESKVVAEEKELASSMISPSHPLEIPMNHHLSESEPTSNPPLIIETELSSNNNQNNIEIESRHGKLNEPLQHVPTLITWSGGGRRVLISGSFNQWKEPLVMQAL